MSTKASIAYGNNFHLYTDLLDGDDVVYLEIGHVECRHETTVAIPADVWEYIRSFSGADLSLVDLDEGTLTARVEVEVDKRIKNWTEAPEKNRGLISLCGSAVYGSVEAPRNEQISAGLDYYLKAQSKQQGIAAKIEAHKARR